MAKANIRLPNGTSIQVEGTPAEISAIIAVQSGASATPAPAASINGNTRAVSAGPIGRITTLRDEGYFRSKRGIGEIKAKLEEKGHHYALTAISTPLLRLVRKGVLRRIKEGKSWTYVQP